MKETKVSVKTRKFFWLSPEQAKKVEVLAQKKAVSQSEFIRGLIDKVKKV